MSATDTTTTDAADPWGVVVGQPGPVATLRAAVANPVHAWLLVGPPGSGARQAARVFAGELLAADAPADQTDRHRALARTDQHPDISVVERKGASIAVAQADDVIHKASRSATEGRRKVLILDEFHLVVGPAAGKLLKTVEEPPPGTFFVFVAEEVTPELVTIASRCSRVDFGALGTPDVIAALLADGVPEETAVSVAAVASGDLDRARLLATDERLALRVQAWRDVPGQLDGSGHTAARLVDELRATIDDAAEPLKAQHAREVADLNEQIERYGQRGSGAAALDERHKREIRRLRTDEVRMGLGELARRYRDALAAEPDPTAALGALAAIQVSAEALVRNPSEELLLQALFVDLPHLA